MSAAFLHLEDMWRNGETLFLSPSLLDSFADCPRKAALKRAGIKSETDNLKFIFGRAAHEAIELFLMGAIEDREMPDVFSALFRKAVDDATVVIAASEGIDWLDQTGRHLMSQFPDWWRLQKIRPVLQECKLDFELAPGVIMRLRPDIIGEHEADVVSPSGDVIVKRGSLSVVDWKFIAPGSHAKEGFFVDSSQPSWYTIGARLQGFPVVGTAYGSAVKKRMPKRNGTPPGWLPLEVCRRAQYQLDEVMAFALHVVEQFRKGYFPRNPRMSFNTPCDGQMTCEFLDLCKYGKPRDLRLPKELKLCQVI
jgi:hypothetical protein